MAAKTTSQEVCVQTPQGDVFGALDVPKSPKLAALLIGGSGPHDRDGITPNLNTGYAAWTKIWNAQGIATLRCDKPGSGTSPLPTQRPAVYQHDLIRNQAALDLMGAYCPDLPLCVIGHSLGALTALVMRHSRLVGLAHLCGAGRTLDRLICDQVLALLNQHKAPQDAIEQHLAERLNVYQTFARGEVLKDLPPWAGNDREALIWIGSACRHDPITLLGRLGTPLCLLFGAADDRIFDIDWKLTRAAAPAAPALLVEGMDHFLRNEEAILNEAALMWVGEQLLKLA